MTAWHTVRFVDEPEPPCWKMPGWVKVRGMEVRIGKMFNRSDIASATGKEKEMLAACNCNEFFLIDLPGAMGYDGGHSNLLVCRRMLEMD